MPGADAARTALMGGTDMPSQEQTAAQGQRQKRGRAEARPAGKLTFVFAGALIIESIELEPALHAAKSRDAAKFRYNMVAEVGGYLVL